MPIVALLCAPRAVARPRLPCALRRTLHTVDAAAPPQLHVIQPKKLGMVKHGGNFLDTTTIIVRGGNGGNGCASFERGPGTPRGPPNGLSGLDGANVVLEATDSMRCLSGLRSHYLAASGARGRAGIRCKAAKDLVVRVPLGTAVRELPIASVHEVEDTLGAPGAPLTDTDLGAAHERALLPAQSLETEGQRIVVARGGAGGPGNARLRINAPPAARMAGQPGETRKLLLELRTLADCGLVGLPNAGKSTLINSLSRANSKVGSYAFTTLAPCRGTLVFADHARLTIADLPGLIAGAHRGRGMGHEFLRHIERAPVLLFVIDIAGADPVADLATLVTELELHHPGLAQRPSIVVANKADRSSVARQGLEALSAWVRERRYRALFRAAASAAARDAADDPGSPWEVIPVSAKFSANVEYLVSRLRELAETHCPQLRR